MKKMKKVKHRCENCKEMTQPDKLLVHTISKYLTEKPAIEWYQCEKCFVKEFVYDLEDM